jgi:hypothetical protein
VLVPLEPVSPELVLVDPEFAQRERSRLCEKARLEELLDVANLRRAVIHDLPVAEREEERVAAPTAATGFLRRRILPPALLCSLVVNGYLAADFVVRGDQNAAAPVPVAAYPVATVTSASPPTVPRGSIEHSGISPAPASKTDVERKLASLVLSAPSRKLPPAFVDPKTGLVRNNVQVVCRAAKHRSYLCTIALGRSVAKRALVVRYRTAQNGGDRFRWYGYIRVR